jgi:hypothetical protein
VLDVGKLPNRSQIVRGCLQDVFELRSRFVVSRHLQQGATERDAGGQVCGWLCETGPSNANRIVVLAGAPMLLGKLRKSNRRRILLDPASKFFNPRVLRHASFYGATVTFEEVDAVDPLLSTTVTVTT